MGEYRSWNVKYSEKYLVQTEPSNCRVYVQEGLVGESPAEGEIGDMDLKVTQYGTYSQQHQYDSLANRSFDFQRLGATTWQDLTPALGGNYTYVIKAFKDGYLPAERKIVISNNDAVLRQALASHGPDAEGNLPSEIHGHRTVLIPLVPAPGRTPRPVEPQQQQQQEQQQQQTVVINKGDSGDSAKLGSGTILLHGSPSNAEVLVDGAFVGNIPTTLRLTTGIHIIEVKCSGYRSFRRELRVLKDSEVTLRADLSKE